MALGSVIRYHENLNTLMYGTKEQISELIKNLEHFICSYAFNKLNQKSQTIVQSHLKQIKYYADPENIHRLEKLRKLFSQQRRPSSLLRDFNQNLFPEFFASDTSATANPLGSASAITLAHAASNGATGSIVKQKSNAAVRKDTPRKAVNSRALASPHAASTASQLSSMHTKTRAEVEALKEAVNHSPVVSSYPNPSSNTGATLNLNADIIDNLATLRKQLSALLSPNKTKSKALASGFSVSSMTASMAAGISTGNGSNENDHGGSPDEVISREEAIDIQQKPIIERLKFEIAKKDQTLREIAKERDEISSELRIARSKTAGLDKTLRLETAKIQEARLQNSILRSKNAQLGAECDAVVVQKMRAVAEKNEIESKLRALQRELANAGSPHKIKSPVKNRKNGVSP